MRTRRYMLLIAFFATWSGRLLFAQQPDSEAAFDPESVPGDEFQLPVDERTAGQIDELIALLGSHHFTERQSATDKLITIGATAFDTLRGAYRKTDDLEVRLRVEEIVYTGYLIHHVFAGKGFLGIQTRRQAIRPTDDERIPVGQLGLRLVSINPDTGAERAGLQKDDIIIALDGQTFTGLYKEAFPQFARSIQKRGPGNQITITVLRGDETLQIQATLGPLPVERFEQINGMPEAVRNANRRFNVWWPKYFLETEESETND